MSQETTYTADDVAAAFRAGLELGRRSAQPVTMPDSFAAGLVEGYARAWGHAPADGGFAERFLRDRNAAPPVTEDSEQAADLPLAATTRSALRLVTEDQVNDVLDGGQAPTGLDLETIEAARRITRRLNVGPR